MENIHLAWKTLTAAFAKSRMSLKKCERTAVVLPGELQVPAHRAWILFQIHTFCMICVKQL